ncbi:MAG: GT4 family glycosyltransferase PelF [Gammaproteobacteria bacterium]|nr:GT4 family glycosyltransferase PelF [Gammaproteobacteria bacterium]
MIDISGMPKAREADIALLLEGSYPFVSGGVSSWVQEIIKGFPQYKFALIFLASSPEDYNHPYYELPENVVHFEIHYLFSREGQRIAGENRKIFQEKMFLHDWVFERKEEIFLNQFRDLDFYLGVAEEIAPISIFKRRKAWDYLTQSYLKYCTDPSFLNYYWNIFSLEKPVLVIANAIQNFIKVKTVHAVSTGYAGFMGALLNHQYNLPLILTEHGIYTRERRIELWQNKIEQSAGWSLDYFSTETNYLQDLWLRFFGLLSHMCYDSAQPIISLFSDAQKQQIEEGAPADKTVIIQNGVNIKRFAKLRKNKPETIPKLVTLIGRVVPIKDIKTFIRAIYLAIRTIPDLQAWVVGNEDEDPKYADECQKLISVFGLSAHIKFKGWQPIDDVMEQSGLVVLSSISEGMPLVILEAFAAGLPVVATDVGSCSELIIGRDQEDRELGAAGHIVQIGNPQQLSLAMANLLNSPEKWQQAQAVAIKRVEALYNQELMFDRYHDIYTTAMGEEKWQE